MLAKTWPIWIHAAAGCEFGSFWFVFRFDLIWFGLMFGGSFTVQLAIGVWEVDSIRCLFDSIWFDLIWKPGKALGKYSGKKWYIGYVALFQKTIEFKVSSLNFKVNINLRSTISDESCIPVHDQTPNTLTLYIIYRLALCLARLLLVAFA